MQKYIKKSEIERVEGFCAYNWVKLNLNQLKEMSKIGIMTDDWQNVPIFEEYLSLLKDGVPKERIRQHLKCIPCPSADVPTVTALGVSASPVGVSCGCPSTNVADVEFAFTVATGA